MSAFISNPKPPNSFTIALAGNPNVGKSTVFNAITGMHQHTGNWAGKTVENAFGTCQYDKKQLLFIDLPGTYSLRASSDEESIARDFICFAEPDAIVVVCDASCLERNLILALQIMELGLPVLLCLNLLDEAEKRKISVDIQHLEEILKIPVIGITARDGKGIQSLLYQLCKLLDEPSEYPVPVTYPDEIESAADYLKNLLFPDENQKSVFYRCLCIHILEDNNNNFINSIISHCFNGTDDDDDILKNIDDAKSQIPEKISISDCLISNIVNKASEISNIVTKKQENHTKKDRLIDKFILGKYTGVPIMLFLFFGILWITIVGANYPSELLTMGFSYLEEILENILSDAPAWLKGILLDGIYKVLSWVIAVMLPPMAIFFPLFTILEDLGYLPRVAYQLDRCFQCANSCGKQSLTMCMSLGCNAVGVTGCRIIDSPRERLIAILTNNFIPCNGRFPTIIALITLFFTVSTGIIGSVIPALLLLCFIALGVGMTLIVSKILSTFILKGMPSAYTLELPPYRRPQFGKVIIRSILDRTLFVLGRACIVAAPAGLLIWILANVSVGDISLLVYLSNILDPVGKFMGLDGAIILAFILGFPANEIVIPILLMIYLSEGTLVDMSNMSELHTLLISNGWTGVTALCCILFMLFHFPCSTTCLTIWKETKSIKWTLASFLIPTICGVVICSLISFFSSMLL